MTDDMPNARFFVIAAVIVIATAVILLTFAGECYCDTCPNRFAIWIRDTRQLCRECKNIHDRNAKRFRRPRGSWLTWLRR